VEYCLQLSLVGFVLFLLSHPPKIDSRFAQQNEEKKGLQRLRKKVLLLALLFSFSSAAK